MNSSASARFPRLPQPSRLKREQSGTVSSKCPRPLDDTALLERIQVGDREALALLFRRYALPVRNIGQRVLRDKMEAEDLVQEVFLYIHRKSTLFDSAKGSARSWIIQVAYTQALLRRRGLKSQGFYLPGITGKSNQSSHASDEGADYDHSVEGLFGRNGWKKIVEDLTQDQSETFQLHFIEGYTFTEIVEKLGQSYAFDLDAQPGFQNASSFQAWGRKGPDKQQARSLGIFYEDNVSKKRWVLKADDPETLEDIDAVKGVTVTNPLASKKHDLLIALLGDNAQS